jgi:hypothetical protein
MEIQDTLSKAYKYINPSFAHFLFSRTLHSQIPNNEPT